MKSELRSYGESRGEHPGLLSPSLIVRRVSVDVNNTELEHSQTELRSCVKIEVAVLGSPSLIVRTVSVDIKQH